MPGYKGMINILSQLRGLGTAMITGPGIIEVTEIERLCLKKKYHVSIEEVQKSMPDLLTPKEGSRQPGEILSRAIGKDPMVAENTLHLSAAVADSTMWAFWIYAHMTMDDDAYGSIPRFFHRKRWTHGGIDDNGSVMVNIVDVFHQDHGINMDVFSKLPIYPQHSVVASQMSSMLRPLLFEHGEIIGDVDDDVPSEVLLEYGLSVGAFLDSILVDRELVFHTDGLDIVFRGIVYN